MWETRWEGFKVSGKAETSKFEAAAKKAQEQTLRWGNKFLRDGIGVYQRWMAQYALPKPTMGMTPAEVAGNENLLTRLKMRRVMLIPNAIKDKQYRHAEQLLREKLREKYSWVVMSDHGWQFFKSAKREKPPKRVRESADIHYRFLLKWAFVGGLPGVGISINRFANWGRGFKGYKSSVKNVTSAVSQATVHKTNGGFFFKMDTSETDTNGNGRGGDYAWIRIARKHASNHLEIYQHAVAGNAGYRIKVGGYRNETYFPNEW